MQTRTDIRAEINSAQFIFSMRHASTPAQLRHAVAILDKHANHLTPGYRAYYQQLTRLRPPEIVSIDVRRP